jgi:hypothetical protein
LIYDYDENEDFYVPGHSGTGVMKKMITVPGLCSWTSMTSTF